MNFRVKAVQLSKAHLLSLRILLDASARRFQAKKIYMRMVAAARWANMRSGILQGQKRCAGYTAALRQADQALHEVCDHTPVRSNWKKWAKFQFNASQELATITDERIVNELRTKDWQAGHWLQEDPPLQTVLNWIRSH